MNTLIVGLCGKKRSGKDTLCASLVSALSGLHCNPRRRALADSLKEEAALALAGQFAPLGISRHRLLDMMYEDGHKEKFRLYLQWYGTEFRRGFFGDDYWTRRMDSFLATWDSLSPTLRDKVLLVPDVRFPNEIDWVRSHGGLLIHVERPGASADAHPSETALDGFDGYDYRVPNNGTLEALAARALHIAQDLTRSPPTQ